jgi:hypothetical protein
MPQLDLTELEAKVLWLILDSVHPGQGEPDRRAAEDSLFEKAYRAYRGMPPQEAA